MEWDTKYSKRGISYCLEGYEPHRVDIWSCLAKRSLGSFLQPCLSFRVPMTPLVPGVEGLATSSSPACEPVSFPIRSDRFGRRNNDNNDNDNNIANWE